MSKILVIDDERAIRNTLKEVLEYEKHEVDHEICIKCDGCRQVCPENAVITR